MSKGTYDESCSTCRFYISQKCKRFPPNLPDNLGGISTQPGVNWDDYCGEWKEKDGK
jgi:hypothetical protein